MYAWLVSTMLRRNIARLEAGDLGPLLSGYAADVQFRFPGDNSWAGEFRGKQELARWLERFVAAGLKFRLEEIIVKGMPWDTTICISYTDHLTTPDGQVVYENRGVIFGKMAWGKVTRYEVFEDTQKVKALDEYLAAHPTPIPGG